MELWLLWWDYAIYRYLEAWCQLGDVLLDVRFVRGDVKIQPVRRVPTQIISPFGGTLLYFKENFHLTFSWHHPFYWYLHLDLASNRFLVSRSFQYLEFCFRYRSFLFTSIMIQSLDKLKKGAGGEGIRRTATTHTRTSYGQTQCAPLQCVLRANHVRRVMTCVST